MSTVGVDGPSARLGRAIASLPRWTLVALIQAYRSLVSPMTGPTCRYYPSCSAYALLAVRRHGALRGSWLAARRLARCHPWAAGGVDDVPPVPDPPGPTRSADRPAPLLRRPAR